MIHEIQWRSKARSGSAKGKTGKKPPMRFARFHTCTEAVKAIGILEAAGFDPEVASSYAHCPLGAYVFQDAEAFSRTLCGGPAETGPFYLRTLGQVWASTERGLPPYCMVSAHLKAVGNDMTYWSRSLLGAAERIAAKHGCTLQDRTHENKPSWIVAIKEGDTDIPVEGQKCFKYVFHGDDCGQAAAKMCDIFQAGDFTPYPNENP